MKLPSEQMYKDEATLVKKVKKWLEPQLRNKIDFFRVVDRYQKGYADIWICAHGRLIVAELKDDTGTPFEHQKQFISRVQKAGGIGGICRSIKDVQDLIDEALYCRCGAGKLYKAEYEEVKFCPRCGKEILET